MDAAGAKTIDLLRELMDSCDAGLQSELARAVWAKTGKSWYNTE
jgi:hypothetical protein